MFYLVSTLPETKRQRLQQQKMQDKFFIPSPPKNQMVASFYTIALKNTFKIT